MSRQRSKLDIEKVKYRLDLLCSGKMEGRRKYIRLADGCVFEMSDIKEIAQSALITIEYLQKKSGGVKDVY